METILLSIGLTVLGAYTIWREFWYLPKLWDKLNDERITREMYQNIVKSERCYKRYIFIPTSSISLNKEIARAQDEGYVYDSEVSKNTGLLAFVKFIKIKKDGQ